MEDRDLLTCPFCGKGFYSHPLGDWIRRAEGAEKENKILRTHVQALASLMGEDPWVVGRLPKKARLALEGLGIPTHYEPQPDDEGDEED